MRDIPKEVLEATVTNAIIRVANEATLSKMIIDKLFNGDIAGPFEYNDVRELANELRDLIRFEQEKAWDKAWIAFQKNNPKNPYRKP